MSRSESVTLGTDLIAETKTFASTRIAGTGVATEALRVYRRAADGYFDDASASISASIFATSGAKSIPWSSSRIRRASSCGSSRWSHRLPSFPSIRRNLVPGAMPCASRVSFGITILPARSTGTTVVINGIDTIPNISRYRRHESSRFTVLRTSSPRALGTDPEWTADTSQPTDGCGTATYRISAPCPDCAIPSGAISSSECMMRSREPIRSPRRCVLDRGGQERRRARGRCEPGRVAKVAPGIGRGGSGPVPQPAEDLPVQVRAHPERTPGQLLQDSPCAGRGDRAGLDPGQQEAEEAGGVSTFRLGNGPCRDFVEDEAVSFRRLEQGCLANPQAEGDPPLPVAPDGDDLDPRPAGLPKVLGFAPREDLVGDRRRDRDLPQEVSEDEDFPDGLEGDQRRGVDPNAHGSALDPGPGSLPVPPQLVQRDSEEGDPFRGREIGHVPDGDPRVLGGAAEGKLQIQVSCEGLLHPQAADPLPEGGPCDFGPGESHFLREFVEVLDFILVHADLEILHMTM